MPNCTARTSDHIMRVQIPNSMNAGSQTLECGRRGADKLNNILIWDLKIGGTTIKTQGEVKYLGVIFDRNLNWKHHIDYV